jgi:hypothetical protein
MRALLLMMLGCRTANAAGDPPAAPTAEDFAALKKQLDDQAAELAALKAAPAKPKLKLGGLQLPPGIEEEDVAWRVAGGLDVGMAVQAAIAQKKYDDEQEVLEAESAKKAAEAESNTKPAQAKKPAAK